MNVSPLTRPLEGPGADDRLRRLQRRFRTAARASAQLSPARLALLCAAVFGLVLATGLLVSRLG